MALQATSVRINTDYGQLKCPLKVMVTNGGQAKGSKTEAHNTGTSNNQTFICIGEINYSKFKT